MNLVGVDLVAFARRVERIVFEAFYDMSDSYYSFACSEDGEPIPEADGELIAIEGLIYERLVSLIDGTGRLLGVLDIDSDIPAAFGDGDAEALETLMAGVFGCLRPSE